MSKKIKPHFIFILFVTFSVFVGIPLILSTWLDFHLNSIIYGILGGVAGAVSAVLILK